MADPVIYKRSLTVLNIILLIAATSLMFSGLVLMSVYHMAKLEFWSWHFYATPLSMLILGIYTFIAAFYGVLISNRESRVMNILLAVFLSIAFLGQIFSVFSTEELRNKIEMDLVPRRELEWFLGNYTESHSVKTSWDRMQKTLRCCGGEEYERGFEDWDRVMRGNVPDSCCHEVEEGCGENKITDANHNHGRDDLEIWKDGCIEVLRQKMKVEVKPMLLAYVGIGVVLALLELLVVVLASAYTAQISRGSRRDKFAWQRRQAGTDVVRNQPETRPVLRTETNF